MAPNPVTIGVEWTDHALKRWDERFPGLDREAVFGRARAAPKKVYNQIRKQCPKHKGALAHWFISYKSALYSRDHKIAFIIGMDPKINQGQRQVVTVFPLQKL